MTEDDDDDMPMHVHRFGVDFGPLGALTLHTMRHGESTRFTFSIQIWRLGVNFGLSYYGN